MTDKVVHLDLEDEQVSLIVNEITRKLISTRQDRTNWDRRVQFILGIIALTSLVFSLGINWSRIANAETKIEDAVSERKSLSERLAKVELSVISQEGSSNLITQQLLAIQSDVRDIKIKVYK